MILLNKLTGPGSVIHSTDGEASVHPVQVCISNFLIFKANIFYQ